MKAAKFAVYDARKTNANRAHTLERNLLETPRGLSVDTEAPNSMAQINQKDRNRENLCSVW